MIKFSNIVKKSFNEQKETAKKGVDLRYKSTRSQLLSKLFSEPENIEIDKKKVDFSNKLGDIFGVENPRNL
jgi:hypothetical protein